MKTTALITELIERQNHFNERAENVRDPAETTSEGRRIISSKNGKAHAAYSIAALPEGRYALSTNLEYYGFAGSSSPWSAFDTREACVECFLSRAREFFGEEPWGCASDGHRIARIEMRELLSGETLFGFEEPPVLAA